MKAEESVSGPMKSAVRDSEATSMIELKSWTVSALRIGFKSGLTNVAAYWCLAININMLKLVVVCCKQSTNIQYWA